MASQDRAQISRIAEQGHKPSREGRGRSPDHCRGGIRRPIPGLHSNSDNVYGFHGESRRPATAAHSGELELLRIHHRRRGHIRERGLSAGDKPPLPRARARRRPECLEQIGKPAAVRSRRRAAAGRASRAARAVRHEHACGDPAGHGGLLSGEEWV